MQVGNFPEKAANSLIEGYCDDFVSLAAVLAQTLEQVAMRGIDITDSRQQLNRIESGMRGLADAIRDLMERQDANEQMADLPDPAEELSKSGSDGPPEDWLPNSSAAPATSQPPAFDDFDDGFDTAPPAPLEDPPAATGNPGATEQQASPVNWDQPTSTDANGADANDGEEKFVGDRANSFFFESITPQPEQETAAPVADNSSDAPMDLSIDTSRDAAYDDPTRTQDTGEAVASAQPTEDTAGDAAAEDDGALRGTNKSMPVLSVFQFLGRTRKSGKMRIQLQDETLLFEFENGCVQSCTSNKPGRGERLGDLLIETTGCSPRDLSNLLNGQSVTATQLGEMVVQAELATNGQVLEALELQVRRRFARACAAKEATYSFRDGTPRRTDGRMRIAPAELTFNSSWDPNS